MNALEALLFSVWRAGSAIFGVSSGIDIDKAGTFLCLPIITLLHYYIKKRVDWCRLKLRAVDCGAILKVVHNYYWCL